MQISDSPVSAVPAMPGRVQVTQPNGFIINTYIKGDEFQNWTEAEDGYSIIKNQKDNYWYYAVKNASGILVPSGSVYLPNTVRPLSFIPHVKPDRNPLDKPIRKVAKVLPMLGSSSNLWTPVPSSGEKKILIIMVEFQNRTFVTTPQNWYDAYFNTTPGYKSTANYYKDNSRGRISITPITTSQPGSPTGVVKVKLSGNHPDCAGNINYYTEVAWINEALSLATAYIDFAALDTNGNGILDNTEASVYYVLAGYEASCTSNRPSIWAHSWQNFAGYPNAISDGIQITPWAVNGELDYNSGQLGIGPTTHETGHQIFGLSDLYDTTSTNEGIGVYSLMGAGSWGYAVGDSKIGNTPVNLDAWSRQYLGWTTPRIPMAEGVMTFGAATATEDSTVRLADPRVNDKEYFLIENRPPTGWDAGMWYAFPTMWTGGLLVLHIDENIGHPDMNDINAFVSGNHQGVVVEEANTTYGSLMNNSSTGDMHHLFYQGNNASFLSGTTPNSKLYDGTNIGVGINSVSLPSDSMTANVIPCPPVATPTFTPDGGTYDTAQSVSINCATAGATIRYTTDGNTPTSGSTLYTGSVNVNKSLTLKAIALYNGVPTSAVKSAAYSLPSGPPINTSLTPNTGTIVINKKTSLASLYTDSSGYANIKNCILMMNSGSTTTGAGYFYYDVANNKLYLKNTADDALTGGFAPGSANVIDNGSIILYCADTTVVNSGNNLTINWSIALKSYFTGNTCTASMQVTDISDITDPMKLMGTFNTSTCKPDMLIKAGIETTYIGTDIFNTDGSSQTKSQSAAPNQKITYAFKVKNAGSANDSFKVTGPAGGIGWNVKYYDLTTGADVTSQVTGSGWPSGTLTPGTSKGIFVNIKPDATIPNGMINSLLITATSITNDTAVDAVKAVTSFTGSYKTDMLIKTGTETSYSGTNIFNADGSNQTKTCNVSAGQKVTYAFRAQNAGNANDSFRITGPAGGSGWSVKYYDLTTNADVTSQVTGSGWISGAIAPKINKGIYAQIKPDSTVPLGSSITLLVTGASESDKSKIDVVKAVTTCVAAYQPDLLIKSGSETVYIGTGIINADGTNQTKSQSASANQKVTYSFRVMNAGYFNDSYTVTGTAGGSGWSVKYYDLTSGVEITSQVTGSGWSSGTLASGIDKGIFVKVSPDATVTSGSSKTLLITAASISDGTKKDVVKAVTTVP